MKLALKDAGLKASDIDDVILVGGHDYECLKLLSC